MKSQFMINFLEKQIATVEGFLFAGFDSGSGLKMKKNFLLLKLFFFIKLFDIGTCPGLRVFVREND